MKKQDVTAHLWSPGVSDHLSRLLLCRKGQPLNRKEREGGLSPWEQPPWVLTWALGGPQSSTRPQTLVAVRTGLFHSNKLRFGAVPNLKVTFPAPPAVLLLTASWACAQLLSCVRFFMIPWSVALQAPLSMAISQARILEWFAVSFSRGSSWPRDRTRVVRDGRRILNYCTTSLLPTDNHFCPCLQNKYLNFTVYMWTTYDIKTLCHWNLISN